MAEFAAFAAPTIPLKVRKAGEYEWATYIKDRHPQFKVHRTVGHAHAALTNRLSYGRNPRQVTADLALYHLEGTDWVPQLQLAYGTVISHFPWQEAPPSPAEQRRERDFWELDRGFSAVISTAERVLQGEAQDIVLTKLRSARAIGLKFIQEVDRSG